MLIKDLTLRFFKNYDHLVMDFDTLKFVGLTGPNGTGKTNLLDAIHYLSMGKSYFNPVDRQNIHPDSYYFNLQGTFLKHSENQQIFCSYVEGKKKTIKKNKTNYDKLANHIGQFPNVIITPYDVKLINEGGEERRRFLDRIISQMDKKYLANITQYQRHLNQRNAQLKSMADSGSHDQNLLTVYNQKLTGLAEAIHKRRGAFIEHFNPIFYRYYEWLSGNNEVVSLAYNSHLNQNNLEALFKENFEKDLSLQRTSCGIHRDDLDFTIFTRSLKRFGSQGQQKSFLIALKLAQYEVIKQQAGIPPLLLLDDIFDRLDDSRVGRLIETITKEDFSQVFITDTSKERLQKVLETNADNLGIFEIENGKLKP